MHRGTVCGLEGRTKLEQARSDTAASPKIMVLADWTTGLS